MKHEEKFWFRWIFNYSLGELLGIGAAAILARLLFMEYSRLNQGHSPTLTALILVIAGTSEGVIIGYVQWKSLSRFLIGFKPGLWITTTALASVIGWMLILPPAVVIVFFFSRLSLLDNYSSMLYSLIAGASFGGLIGVAQFFIVRKYFDNAIIWILANAVGWGFSFMILFLALSFLSGSFVNILLILLACALSGLIQGVVTGTTLHFLMNIRSNARLRQRTEQAL